MFAPLKNNATAQKGASQLRTVAGAVGVVILLSVWVYAFISNSPGHRDGAAGLSVLRAAFDDVPVMTGSSPSEHLFAQSKPGSNLVEQRYLTKSPLSSILDYYDGQLQGRGWSFRMSHGGFVWKRESLL